MELRQLRYFVRVVELGSMGRAAHELGVVTSALSQQISRLEGELSTRLLQRTSTGVIATQAGMAFMRQAQLALRHAEGAVLAARQARLSGYVSVGLAPTTSTLLAVPFVAAMRERYPDVRLHMVESLSGNLASMLDTRQIDLAILFNADTVGRWSVLPLLQERLFLVASPHLAAVPKEGRTSLPQIKDLPLILPSAAHGLRAQIRTACTRAGIQPTLYAEVDGLAMLMDMVKAAMGATIQPGAATTRPDMHELRILPLEEDDLVRPNLLVSLDDDELSPAGLAARVVLADVARRMVQEGRWPGAALHGS